jgi:hypothetical protein
MEAELRCHLPYFMGASHLDSVLKAMLRINDNDDSPDTRDRDLSSAKSELISFRFSDGGIKLLL